MNAKIKIALAAIAVIAGNEILTWAILLIIAIPFVLNLLKEAVEHD